MFNYIILVNALERFRIITYSYRFQQERVFIKLTTFLFQEINRYTRTHECF